MKGGRIIQTYNHDNRQPAAAEYKYELPCANAAIDYFLALANIAKKQALAEENTCRIALFDNESSFNDVLASPPQIKETMQRSFITGLKALIFCAEATSQAQISVCEALQAAETTAAKQRDILTERQEAVRREINELEQIAEDLRTTLALISGDSQAEDAYNSHEAKTLLECLEAAYQKHGLLKSLQKGLLDTESNLAYIIAKHEQERQHNIEIWQLVENAVKNWQRACELFQIVPEPLTEKMVIHSYIAKEMPAALPKEKKPEPAPPKESAAEEPKKGKRGFGALIWSYVKIIIVALLFSFVLRAYVFDITSVDGISMDPTLHDQDRLITSKISYLLGEPQRGDIVVVNAPDSPGEKYIKRIIGLPNESIRIQDGKVYINDVMLMEPYLQGVTTNGDDHTLIPDGFYYVMGDNRSESRDSRSDQVGTISSDNIHGKAVFRIAPFDSLGTL